MRRILGLTLLLVFTSIAGAATASEVSVESGVLASTSSDGVDVFKGIPYAAAPVGTLRWAPPVPAASWSGKRDASDFGPICPQPKRPDAFAAISGDRAQSEDCLSLNIWAPHGARGVPVMVWIHGGAHRFGSGSSALYDGSKFARDGIVLVTLNYRLGLLGYFAHPALTKAATVDAPLGNYGAMDQLAALKWVQRNIAAFGGNPANVTVFGESAGGASILYLLSNSAAKGLFARAIVESGGGWSVPTTLAQKEEEGVAFADRQGLPGANATLEQLRALPVEKTFDMPANLGFGPFVDGRLFERTPMQAFSAGRQIAVPMMIGSNSYEASLMKLFALDPQRITARLSPDARAIYSADAASDSTLADAVFTDSVMGAPAHWIATRASSSAPAYLYHFSYVTSLRRGVSAGAAHGSEIPYVFATGTALAAGFGLKLSPEDLATERLVHSCWVGFAKTGKPDCDGQDWPAFSADNDALLEIASKPQVLSHFRKAQYQALEAVLVRN